MSGTREHAGRPTAGRPLRRRPRQETPRPRTVRFDLTEDEFAELEKAAGRAGLAKGAYAAEAALAAARYSFSVMNSDAQAGIKMTGLAHL